MKKTVSGLLSHCKKAVVNKVQYVYGAKMQVMSYAQIKALQNTYGKNYVWNEDLKNAGKLCCDCSGLISSYTGITRGSSQYKATATASVSIATLTKNWSKYVGWGLWMNGHIGVVSDTEGYYYAMDGSARDMVHYPMSKQKWALCIKLCDIDYTKPYTKPQNTTIKKEDDEVIETGTISVNGKDIKIDKIVKDGNTFIKVRGLENAGFKVGFDSGSKNITLDNKINQLPIIIDGKTITVNAINLDGYNYAQIRDIANAVGTFDVGYNNGKVIINKK